MDQLIPQYILTYTYSVNKYANLKLQEGPAKEIQPTKKYFQCISITVSLHLICRTPMLLYLDYSGTT